VKKTTNYPAIVAGLTARLQRRAGTDHDLEF
jgi:hypothetical protein